MIRRRSWRSALIGRGASVKSCLPMVSPGVHFYTLNRSLATQRIFARLRESSVAGLLPAYTAPSPSAAKRENF